jgi:undecaprenyl-diphosphatase
MDRRLPPWLPLACLAGFVVLTVLVAVGGAVDTVDESVRRAFAEHRDPTLTALARDLTDVASPALDALLLAVGAGYVAWRTRRLGPLVAAGVTGWLMAVTVLTFKHVIARPSPPGAATTHSESFPSGHTAAALVCFGALALLLAQLRPSLLRPLVVGVGAVAVAVAGALVYNDYHWLSDTVASIALGAGMLGLLHRWLART